jgi:hypothetical protein
MISKTDPRALSKVGNPMALPEGFTCQDCNAFRYCSNLGVAKAEQTNCDWLPVRFSPTLKLVRELRTALEESVLLQSHYASLLNQYDGGQRIGFTDASAWIKRLREIGTLKGGA